MMRANNPRSAEAATGGRRSNGRGNAKDRAQRFSMQMSLRYRVKGETKWRKGKTENISRTGVLFRGEVLADANSPIEMGMVLPAEVFGDPAAEVVCKGTVVRTVPSASPQGMPALATTISQYRLVRL